MPEATTTADIQKYFSYEVVDTDRVVVVTCVIPKHELKDEPPAELRERYGEKVYATALRKAGLS